MPGVGHDGGLALWTIDGEELVGLVVGIRIAHGYDDLARLDIELAAHKLLVEPELLDVHLAALLYLGLIFARLLGLDLYGSTVAAMLKLDLRTQRPAIAEVIAQIQDHVGQVEASVTLVVGIVLGFLVAVEALAVEVARHHGFTIASDVQARQSVCHLLCL